MNHSFFVLVGHSWRCVAATVIVLLLFVATSESKPDQPAVPEGKQPANELVQAVGRITNITPTGKRHQSYIFEFRITHQLRGPGQEAAAKERVVRFELYQDFGGVELLNKLNVGADTTARLNVDDVVKRLPKSPRFQLVLWLTAQDEIVAIVNDGKKAKVDSVLVRSGVAVLD